MNNHLISLPSIIKNQTTHSFKQSKNLQEAVSKLKFSQSLENESSSELLFSSSHNDSNKKKYKLLKKLNYNNQALKNYALKIVQLNQKCIFNLNGIKELYSLQSAQIHNLFAANYVSISE